ncbi:MAG TPA: NAD(P)-dependent alcohol dehydrogenase, partial [Anaeromyxobacter sp.]
MKAVEYDRYGPSSVLVVREVARPSPGPGELLVHVRAAALNPKDVLVRSGKLRLLAGRRFPKRAGFDWAGEIAEVGPGVEGVQAGSAWYGMLGGYQGGACAEYLVVRRGECAPKPASLGFEHAAAVPLAASTALQALRDVARLQPGMRVLVNGASGGVGVFAVQIARILGAHVTTTSSAGNLELCRRLGADVALDYRATDPLAGPDRFDVVLDVFGNRRLSEARSVLARRGVYVTTVPKPRVFADVALTLFTSPRARMVSVRPRARDLALVARHVDEGRLVPVVEHVFPLDRIAEAEEQAGSKHTRG